MALEEAREAALSHADASLGQGRTEFIQVDAGLRLVERQDQVGLRLDPVRALISAHRLRRDVALAGALPTPASGARQTAPAAFSRLMPGRPCLDGMDYALSQIDGQG